tara:strand:+ start:2304 stop:4313 length:2010 start_codon:yes stop_codon:yes gene_type:complete
MVDKNKKTYLVGDFIFREGDQGNTAYVVESGVVELVKFTGEDYVTLSEITAGTLFGEMAIIDGSPRSASARAKEECMLNEITEAQLKAYMSRSPDTSMDMMRRLASYARTANEKLNKDAFEVASEELNTNDVKNIKNSQTEKIDKNTSNIIKEFNDDIDQFSDITPDRKVFLTGSAILILVIIFIVWASIAKIDITLSTQGKLSTEVPNVSVQANYNSVISKIFKNDGDIVVAGQPLVSFDETLLASDIRDVKISLLSTMNTLSRLKAEINLIIGNKSKPPKDPLQLALYNGLIEEIRNHNSLNQSTLIRLNNDGDVLANEIEEISSKLNNIQDQTVETIPQKIFTIEQAIKIINNEEYQTPIKEPSNTIFKALENKYNSKISSLNEEAKILKAKYDRAKNLFNSKAISDKDLEDAKQSFIKKNAEKEIYISSELQSLIEQKFKLNEELIKTNFVYKNKMLSLNKIKTQVEEIKINSEVFKNNLLKIKNSEFESLSNQKLTLEERLIKLERQQKDRILESPISGTILKTEDIYAGSVISPGTTILTIVPENVELFVLVDIKPSDITNVFEGAKVKILLNALPSQKHGELIGELVNISKDTIDEDISGEKASVYRGKIKIVENKLRNVPSDFNLLPGMNVSGNIISGKRPVITYLIYPVIKTINTAMREP